MVRNRETLFFCIPKCRTSKTEPPHLNWSTATFRKRRTANGNQVIEDGRDFVQASDWIGSPVQSRRKVSLRVR